MRTLRLFLCIVLLGACCQRPHSQDLRNKEPSTAQRIVVIGDIHADLGMARASFRLAGGIDKNDNWIGGSLVIVQLGDFIGRSYEDREVLDFLIGIKGRADQAGGTIHLLIGNHEVFGSRLEQRWVAREAYEAFEGLPGLDLTHQRLVDLADYQRPRAAALMPGGHYALELSKFPAVLHLGDTIFAHGGVTPFWAKYGIEKINEDINQWFLGQTSEPVSALGVDAGNSNDGVMWSRHFSDEVGEDDCLMLEESLAILGARRMIVAHTVKDSIASYCDGAVWAIDTGMSRYYGGKLQLLEIIDDATVTVLLPQSSVPE
jgi:hypothetical protein